MAFETIYENYQITINYFVEELQNEGKQTTKKSLFYKKK
jgi:hypothetical protein|tara:strand:- start:209 stop:325 length:117 start_codon:yes stop_codon:yes gene_type:complete